MDSKKKNLYETEIANVPLKLLSEHSEEFVQEIVELVDDKVNQALEKQAKSLQDAAILAALNIAEEYFLLKYRAIQQVDQITLKAENVLAQSESSSKGLELSN